MCAPNKTKKGNKTFSYLFCTHLVITISAIVFGRHVKNGSFLHQVWIACQWIALSGCSIISTKH